MRNIKSVEHSSSVSDEMQDEYRFDYGEAKPNRFAPRIGRDQLMIVLDPDVAAVFKTPESVNRYCGRLSPQCQKRKKGSTELRILFYDPCKSFSKSTQIRPPLFIAHITGG